MAGTRPNASFEIEDSFKSLDLLQKTISDLKADHIDLFPTGLFSVTQWGNYIVSKEIASSAWNIVRVFVLI